jgi:hypothetical protein
MAQRQGDHAIRNAREKTEKERRARGARCVKGQRSIVSEGENGLGGVDKQSSESESEDALRQAKAFA